MNNDRMNVAQPYATGLRHTEATPGPLAERSTLPTWIAAIWAIVLFWLLPPFNGVAINDAPQGTFLVFQLTITVVSVVAGAVLLFHRQGRWPLLKMPFVIFLAFEIWNVWTRFP